jgi:hypothetical protein
MTMEEKKVERSPLSSKKFIAAMIWNLFWLALIGYGIRSAVDASVLSAMVYCSGLSQLCYLGGQSAVDAFVRAAIAKNGFSKLPTISDIVKHDPLAEENQ